MYSTADRNALHVRLADQAVCVGPPTATESYLHIPSVIAAGVTTGCDAVHPGYGFLSENPAFVEACAENDLVFVGPPASVMTEMGDKVAARAAMRAADVPTVPGTDSATTIVAARAAADELGYPILLKAVGGGGGRGMRVVETPAEIEDSFGAAAAEAEAAFGDSTLYVEKLLALAAARGDPGGVRRGRQRAHARRARVLDPAAAPEADRGVAVAGPDAGATRGDGGGGGARLPCGRVRERGHARVPARAGRVVLLHRAERTASGRAPGDGDVHGHRPRPDAARGRRGRAARAHGARVSTRPRGRGSAERRGSGARFPADAGRP